MDTSYLNQPTVHRRAQGGRLTLLLHSIGMKSKQRRENQSNFIPSNLPHLGFYGIPGAWIGLSLKLDRGGVQTAWQGALHWAPF